MTRHVVAAVGEIPEGGCKIVTVAGREIGVFLVGGRYAALINRCPHEGAALCRGVLVGLMAADRPGAYRLERAGELLRCPWHGWEFDVFTGQSWCEPDGVRARSYSVTVEPGAALGPGDMTKGPFAAETVPVSVERAYVVVEV